MKVGDLVRHIPNGAIGLIVSHSDWSTLVKWRECETVEDANSYDDHDLEVTK